jgi:Cu-processing system permease protein
LNHTLLIGFREFRDRLRNGWVIASMVLWLAAITLTSVFGLIQMGRIGIQGYERTAITLLNLAQYLAPLLGLLVGHDLIVREREDRTIHLLIASGVRRAHVMLGKFLGGALAVTVPLLVGFVVAGTLVGIAARDATFTPFIKLAISGVGLGVVFSGLGMLVSTFSRSRVQALVCALLVWGVAVFGFDLAALGVIVSTNAPKASQEIEMVCDATHVNSQVDPHSAFEGAAPVSTGASRSDEQSFSWLLLNPVDVFRIINLPHVFPASPPLAGAFASALAWLAFSMTAAIWRFARTDL